MKISILGSGTCTSQLPNVENRFPPAFLVDVDGVKVLFDCSEGVRFRLEKVGCAFETVHHVAISHSHPDHCALFHFIQAVFVKGLWAGEKSINRDLQVYCPQMIVDDFDKLWSFYFPEMEGKRWEWPVISLNSMADGFSEQTFEIADGIVLKGRSVYHGFGKVDAVCFRLETPKGIFAYSGDTGICDGLKEMVQGADFFICEASARIGDFESSTGYGHLNPFEAGQIAKAAGVKKMVIVHYTGFDSDEAMLSECRRSGFEGELIVGKDFMEFEV